MEFPQYLGTPQKARSTLRGNWLQQPNTGKLAMNMAIDDCHNCWALQMYRKHHNDQLSIEEFHVPFGGMLDPDNHWVNFSALMPWVELDETYATQFNPTTGAPAKPVRVAFGALFIKQRLG
jgi:hypothetical protein